MEKSAKKDVSGSCQSSANTAANKKDVDERRLRKLKVYLRSVSYNSCEGLPNFPTLPDLYKDTILSEEFPCDTMKLSSRQYCAPTPFLIACCFNRRYPVNARKRAGNMRSRPSRKQGSETFTKEKKELHTQVKNVSSEAGQSSKTSEKVYASGDVTGGKNHEINKDKVQNRVNVIKGILSRSEKNCVGECVKVQKSISFIDRTTNDKEKDDKKHSNSISQLVIKATHSDDKTEYTENSCEKVRDENDSNEKKTSELNKLKNSNTTKAEVGKKENILTNRQEHDCERKKYTSEDDDEQFEVSNTLKNISSTRKSTPENKIEADGLRDGACSVLSDYSSSGDSTIERQELKSNIATISQTAITSSSKANNITSDVNRVHTGPEKEKSYVERNSPLQRQFAEDEITNISNDSSCCTSPRLAALCSRHKIQAQSKEKKKHKRDPKIAENMKLKINVKTNTRLRCRAMIKQPGHENRYTKGGSQK